mmetsp:Transcript_413/g.699  ORF Transcript_413/g.699 Transcript_413/m.699 type:complete len:913 (-) Transcript_413:118-2856(-)
MNSKTANCHTHRTLSSSNLVIIDQLRANLSKMFRIKNQRTNNDNKKPITTAATTITASPSKNTMSAIRLPFLIVNQNPMELHCSPNNFKHLQIPTTPATIQSMTPTASTISSATSSYGATVPSTSHSAYVDIDSSVESDDDCQDEHGSVIPSNMDAEFEAMLSPSFSSQCIFESNGASSTVMQRNISNDPLFFSNDNIVQDDQSISSMLYEESISNSKLFSASCATTSRMGIGRPSYSPSYSDSISDVSPILNARNTKQYTDPNENSQYYRDTLYQQKHKARDSSDKSSSSEGVMLRGISSVLDSTEPSSHNINYDLQQAQGSPIHVDKHECLSSDLALDNERFITPGQAFVKRQHELPRHLIPSKSPQRAKGKGLGITPPPKTRSSRVLVPHVTPPSRDVYTIYILVIQPTAKLYELIRLNYNPATTTIGDLLHLVHDRVTEDSLKEQKHIGLCRPRGSSSSSRSLTNPKMTASVMARDGTCARILCGEVLVAIPEGYSGKEVQILSQHILKFPKMKRLLQRTDPLLEFGKRNDSKNAVNATNSQSSTSLGIQPMSKQTVQQQQDQQAITEIGTFSSSILFGAIQEDKEVECDMAPPRRSHGIMLATRRPCHDDDYSVSSIKYNSSTEDICQQKINVPKPESSGGLTMEQLDEIKREAAEAARLAAEEAFALRMQQLVEELNVSPDEKARIVGEPLDDVSFHSTVSCIIQSKKEQDSDMLRKSSSLESTLEQSDCSSPRAVDPEERDYLVLSTCAKDTHSVVAQEEPSVVYSETLLDDNEEMELIASCMQGIFAAALQAVTEFLDQNKSRFHSLRNKLAKRKVALKAMAAVSLIFLSTLIMNQDEDENGQDVKSLTESARLNAMNEPFKMSDLQQVVFWFMMMVQGQNYITKLKSKRRRRPLWRSRLKAIA